LAIIASAPWEKDRSNVPARREGFSVLADLADDMRALRELEKEGAFK
jgi:hypothetical protein